MNTSSKKYWLLLAVTLGGTAPLARADESSASLNAPNSVEVDPKVQVETSDWWYRHPDPGVWWEDCYIIDPDGWRLEKNPKTFWHSVKITKKEFERRFARCSIVASKYPISDHLSKRAPF